MSLADWQLSETSFSAPDWLARFPLNAETVMDYFALSPFYDNTCNNEELRMQRRHGQLMNGTDAPIAVTLQQMEGLQYEVMIANEPHLFVVQKHRRLSPIKTTPLAVFHIITGNIFQAPTLSGILTSRLLSGAHELDVAFKLLADSVRFTPTLGYHWASAATTRKGQTAAELGKQEVQAPAAFSRSIDGLLKMLEGQAFNLPPAVSAAKTEPDPAQLISVPSPVVEATNVPSPNAEVAAEVVKKTTAKRPLERVDSAPLKKQKIKK